MKNIFNNKKEPLNESFIQFDEFYTTLMKDMEFKLDLKEKTFISGKIPDKWDIIAGLILTGVISISIIGLSTASYYIALGLYNANILCYVGAIITEAEIIEKNKKKIIRLLEGELKWLLSGNTLYLASSELKNTHLKIKTFLMNHFKNEKNFTEQFKL